MALTFKTPGVYLQEESKLPSSVAEVATAIPAFIGYTQIARSKIDGDLNMVPTRITSLLDYETYFGFAANETGISVDVSAEGVIVVNGPVNKSPFIMYYQMQMYFANGGGPCYITSVGQFLTPPASGTVATLVEFDELEAGLNEIKKQDEPTLLVFPDATSLQDPDDLYALYSLAMDQSRDLQDRFTILDTANDLSSAIGNLRDKITNDPLSLKYGAAYYPFLNTRLDFSYLDSAVEVTDANAPTFTQQATTISNSIITSPQLTSWLQDLQDLKTGLTAPNLAASKTAIHALVAKILTYMSTVSANLTAVDSIIVEALAHPGSVPTTDLTIAQGVLSTWADDNINDNISPITTANAAIIATGPSSPTLTETGDLVDDILELLNLPDPFNEKIDDLKAPSGPLGVVVDELTPFINEDAFLSSYELNNNVMYNRIKSEIAKVTMKLPPSASIAGVYARTDNNSGVWTAPANASLNYVIAPSVFIDNQMQDDMNVTTTGKSVNAIRSFTGRGTLVWGARTLTGNSNEWRYISVRRFFNMVEESVKKASEPYVFQGNDANTWVKVQAMIENFLILQWKAGALTGAKPEQAFYVNIGLGKTMTAQDILEGRMIVEIGMAVVRPAEFIVLKFSHKMQEA